jgi:sulfate/thiosulfate transport system substrate-binding protein
MLTNIVSFVKATSGVLRVVVLPPLLLALVVAVAAACGGSSAQAEGDGSEGGGNGGTLSLVAYSTPREVYEELIPLFQETDAGQGFEFEQSYASSGEQSRAVEAGLPADVVAFSLEPDVTRLVDAGLLDADWASDEYKGMVSNSVVVFAVRKGNPEGIRTWDDLLREGVEVITPNPFTSGGAQWNIMAAYGAQLELGKSEEEAIEYLRELFLNHVPVQDKSARESLQTFSAGKGDVLLAYENEAIFVQQAGEELEYVVPEQTILIENPVAVVSTSENAEAAQAFVDFIRTPEAQRIFGEKGYRPVNQEVAGEFDYPEPPGLFTIADLGGWPDVRTRFFDREDGVFAEIEKDLGVSTE